MPESRITQAVEKWNFWCIVPSICHKRSVSNNIGLGYISRANYVTAWEPSHLKLEYTPKFGINEFISIHCPLEHTAKVMPPDHWQIVLVSTLLTCYARSWNEDYKGATTKTLLQSNLRDYPIHNWSESQTSRWQAVLANITGHKVKPPLYCQRFSVTILLVYNGRNSNKEKEGGTTNAPEERLEWLHYATRNGDVSNLRNNNLNDYTIEKWSEPQTNKRPGG